MTFSLVVVSLDLRGTVLIEDRVMEQKQEKDQKKTRVGEAGKERAKEQEKKPGGSPFLFSFGGWALDGSEEKALIKTGQSRMWNASSGP